MVAQHGDMEWLTNITVFSIFTNILNEDHNSTIQITSILTIKQYSHNKTLQNCVENPNVLCDFLCNY